MAAPHEKFTGYVYVLDLNSNVTIALNGDSGDITLGGNGKDGDVIVTDPSGRQTIRLDGGHGTATLGGNGTNGNLYVYDRNDQKTIHLDGKGGNIWAGGNGQDGDIVIFPKDVDTSRENVNEATIHLDGDKASISAGGERANGDLILWGNVQSPDGDTTKVKRIHLDAGKANIWLGGNDQDGDIVIFPKDATNRGDGSNVNEATIHLDGDAGDIKLMGADCAEYFTVGQSQGIEPGAVLVAGKERSLELCNQAYDKRVVGVISGAGDFKPGIVLNKKIGKGKSAPVALVGTVFCKVDAQYAVIEVGDLLTTSPSPGHAMKAIDADKAFGAVLGKSLDSLDCGQGLIPVLVTLR